MTKSTDTKRKSYTMCVCVCVIISFTQTVTCLNTRNQINHSIERMYLSVCCKIISSVLITEFVITRK